MKKVLSIVLAVLMVCAVLPFAAFAEDTAAETTADETVNAWEANYDILLDKLLDSSTYSHYKYVVDNEKTIQQTMDVYTAFGLYDNAWQNYATKDANTATCEKILLCMIEKYSYDMGESYVDDIVKVLETASSAADFLEKVNGYVDKYTDVLSFVNSDTWGTTFEVVNILIKAGKTWAEIRTGLIDAYSQIISVQMANGYYIDMLQYVADNTTYAPMKTAAENLITEATTAVNDQMNAIVASALNGPAGNVATTLVNLAMDTNVYTATAKKIYSGATKVADILWNTSDQYALYDDLVASYYAELPITEWVINAFDKEAEDYDANRTLFAASGLMSVRAFGEDAMYNLKVAQSGGVIGKIQSKLNNAIYTEYTANIAELAMMKTAFYDTAVADMIPVNEIDYIYCPVDVTVSNSGTTLFTVADGAVAAAAKQGTAGFASASYSAYNKEYIKVLFLSDTADRIVLTGKANGYVTFVKYIQEDGAINDYSFTEKSVASGDNISIDGLTYTIVSNGNATQGQLSDTFVIPEGKKPTVQDVTTAVTEVTKDEANSFLAKIKAFFENLFASIKALFSIKK